MRVMAAMTAAGIPGQRVAEKDMTLDVAQRLKRVLAASGYRVVMTRDSDVFVSLGGRVALANSYANALFVCIHFNSAKRMGRGWDRNIFL
jgi:N-acetylmuramoyl-L-alanine amidase